VPWIVFVIVLQATTFEQPNIAASLTRFLRSCSGNMNSDGPHRVMFLYETLVFANGTESRIWNDSTSQSAKKRPVLYARYSIAYAVTQSGYVSGASFNFCFRCQVGRLQ
jgi:hypothetical protein